MPRFAKGFLVGLLCGAAAALLLTPRSGVENRALVSRRLREALEAGLRASEKQEQRMRARYRRSIGAAGEE